MHQSKSIGMGRSGLTARSEDLSVYINGTSGYRGQPSTELFVKTDWEFRLGNRRAPPKLQNERKSKDSRKGPIKDASQPYRTVLIAVRSKLCFYSTRSPLIEKPSQRGFHTIAPFS